MVRVDPIPVSDWAPNDDPSTNFTIPLSTVIISAFRLASIKEIDYADLTYNIPKALIFSSLEPSLGVTLACIPLLRPLLGRSKYTNNGATQYHVSNHRTGGVSGTVGSGAGEVQKDGFPVLDDDSSQYQLRALDGRHNHNTSVSNENMGNRRSSDGEDSNSVVVEGTMNQRITVQRSWLVSSS